MQSDRTSPSNGSGKSVTPARAIRSFVVSTTTSSKDSAKLALANDEAGIFVAWLRADKSSNLGLLLAHRCHMPRPAICRLLGVDRTWLTRCHNDPNDPLRTRVAEHRHHRFGSYSGFFGSKETTIFFALIRPCTPYRAANALRLLDGRHSCDESAQVCATGIREIFADSTECELSTALFRPKL